MENRIGYRIVCSNSWFVLKTKISRTNVQLNEIEKETKKKRKSFILRRWTPSRPIRPFFLFYCLQTFWRHSLIFCFSYSVFHNGSSPALLLPLPSVCLSFRLIVCLSFCPTVCLLSVRMSCFRLFACLSIRLSVCLSVCPSVVCLSVFLSFCLSPPSFSPWMGPESLFSQGIFGLLNSHFRTIQVSTVPIPSWFPSLRKA